MKVYVVIYDDYECLEVLGIFTDEDEAKELAQKGSKYYIREFTPDSK